MCEIHIFGAIHNKEKRNKYIETERDEGDGVRCIR